MSAQRRGPRLFVLNRLREPLTQSACRLATQCVANVAVAHEARVFRVKLPDELQIIDRIARPEIDFKPLGEILQQSLPIPSSPSTLLLLLDVLPTDQPICDDLGCVLTERATLARTDSRISQMRL